MRTYKDIYEFPLTEDWGRVSDSKDNFVFQFIQDNREVNNKLLNVINGNQNLENKELIFIHKGGYIINSQLSKETPIILIRGWGNLTGIGAHNLPTEEAANIQDTFANYIVERLNYRVS